MNTITKDIKPNRIAIIGDIHGDFNFWFYTISEMNQKDIHTIQIGDFGIGFKYMDTANAYFIADSENNHKMNSVFIGNHDNHSIAEQSPLFLDRFGYDSATDIFWIGGAYSIDKDCRTPGVSWWEDEELSQEEMESCRELYILHKPNIVLTHDGPFYILCEMFPEYMRVDIPPSRTQNFLQDLFSEHAPALWFFGHHHRNRTVETEKTLFRCIGEKEVVIIDV